MNKKDLRRFEQEVFAVIDKRSDGRRRTRALERAALAQERIAAALEERADREADRDAFVPLEPAPVPSDPPKKGVTYTAPPKTEKAEKK